MDEEDQQALGIAVDVIKVVGSLVKDLAKFRQGRKQKAMQKGKNRSKKALKPSPEEYAEDLNDAIENLFVVLSTLAERLQQFKLAKLDKINEAEIHFTNTFSKVSPELGKAYKNVPRSLQQAVVIGCSFLAVLIPELEVADKDPSLPRNVILGVARAALSGSEREETFNNIYLVACELLANACNRLSFFKVGHPLFPTFPSLATGLPWATKEKRYRDNVVGNFETLGKFFYKYGFPQPEGPEDFVEFIDYQYGFHITPKIADVAIQSQRTPDSRQCKLPQHDEQAKGSTEFGGFIAWLLLGAEGTVRGCASIFFQEREVEVIKWVGNAPGYLFLLGDRDFTIDTTRSKKLTPGVMEAFRSFAVITHPRNRVVVAAPPPPMQLQTRGPAVRSPMNKTNQIKKKPIGEKEEVNKPPNLEPSKTLASKGNQAKKASAPAKVPVPVKTGSAPQNSAQRNSQLLSSAQMTPGSPSSQNVTQQAVYDGNHSTTNNGIVRQLPMTLHAGQRVSSFGNSPAPRQRHYSLPSQTPQGFPPHTQSWSELAASPVPFHQDGGPQHDQYSQQPISPNHLQTPQSPSFRSTDYNSSRPTSVLGFSPPSSPVSYNGQLYAPRALNTHQLVGPNRLCSSLTRMTTDPEPVLQNLQQSCMSNNNAPYTPPPSATFRPTQLSQQQIIQQQPVQQPVQQPPMRRLSMQQPPTQQLPLRQLSAPQSPFQQLPIQQSPMQRPLMQQPPVRQLPVRQTPIQPLLIQRQPIMTGNEHATPPSSPQSPQKGLSSQSPMPTSNLVFENGRLQQQTPQPTMQGMPPVIPRAPTISRKPVGNGINST